MHTGDTNTHATGPLAGRCYLITGIHDEASLATAVARELADQGARVVCSGLGPTRHHEALSARARNHLATSFESFCKTVERALDARALALCCDLTVDASVRDRAADLGRRGIVLDGFVHAVARDRTLGRDGATPLLEVSREAFLDCLDVSAYSLIALARELLAGGVLARGASLVSLSYLGAERVVAHSYKNVAVAKAALERITVELAHELGVAHDIRVNAVRFSPYAASRAGGAIPGLAAAEASSGRAAALGNARPADLAREVVHLLAPGHTITGDVRNVDGGLHLLAGGAGAPI
jgi:enoyl-[acyl-carrier protein] reductase I